MRLIAFVAAVIVAVSGCKPAAVADSSPHRPPLAERLRVGRFSSGQPVFVRIFKSESRLQLWLRDGERYRLFESYRICRWSGKIGPKMREGDDQAPEGFYRVTPSQMNPHSRYRRAFNVGFLNAYDGANGRTGSDLMVHGGCSSSGCYAMTDAQIDEIYTLMQAALDHGQAAIPVDILPFQPTEAALAAHATSPWAAYWRTLAEGAAIFDNTGRPAAVFACGKAYAFSSGAGCKPIRAEARGGGRGA